MTLTLPQQRGATHDTSANLPGHLRALGLVEATADALRASVLGRFAPTCGTRLEVEVDHLDTAGRDANAWTATLIALGADRVDPGLSDDYRVVAIAYGVSVIVWAHAPCPHCTAAGADWPGCCDAAMREARDA